MCINTQGFQIPGMTAGLSAFRRLSPEIIHAIVITTPFISVSKQNLITCNGPQKQLYPISSF